MRKKERTRSARRFCFRRRRRRKNERGAREKNERTHLDVSLERLDRFLAFDDHHVILSSFFARLDRLSLAREEDPSFPVKRSPVLSLSGEKNEQQKHAKESLRESLRERQERERERQETERETEREREERGFGESFLFFWPCGTKSLKSVVCRGFPLFSAFCLLCFCFIFLSKNLSLLNLKAHISSHFSSRRSCSRAHRYTHTLFDLFYFRSSEILFKKEHLL